MGDAEAAQGPGGALMKAGSAWTQVALAGGALVLAYFTWQRPVETANVDEVVALEATKNSLERVRYEDGTRFLELYKEGSPELIYWVRQGFLPGKEPKPPPASDAGSTDGGRLDAGVSDALTWLPPAPTRDMRLSEQGRRTWERFTPFRVARALGKLPDDKLKELGLPDSDRRLMVTVAGALKTFRVSAPQAGLVGSYAQDLGDGRVYLVSAQLMSELEPAGQLTVERRLHTFRLSDFDEFTVTLGPTKREFVIKGGEVPQTAQIALKTAPDKPSDFARNWHDKVWSRLIITEVLGRGEVPKSGEPRIALRVDYAQKGRSVGFVELGETKKGEIYARSENTAGWVALHQGVDEYIIEAGRVLEGR